MNDNSIGQKEFKELNLKIDNFYDDVDRLSNKIDEGRAYLNRLHDEKEK